MTRTSLVLMLALCTIATSGCPPKLPVCSPDAVGDDKWSKPCRSADEVDTESGEADEPDPTDLDAGE